MAPARSSSTTTEVAATGAEEEVTEQSPSVAAISAPVAVAPTMGAMAKEEVVVDATSTEVIKAAGLSTTTTTTSSSLSSSSAAAGAQGKKQSDGVNSSSGSDQQEHPVSESFIRSLSGSKLSAEAPEFVPKGILAPPVVGLVPGLISGRSLPIPGVLPVQFAEPLVPSSQLNSSSSIAATSPPLVTVSSASPPLASELEEGFSAHDSSPPQSHATSHAHAAHTKPVVTDELKAKIVKQVEFYFSDQNLPTDNYLMKFIKKDPDGFVPIPVVASFRKIKNLAKNHGVVAAALRNSTQLMVSDDGKKVRRVQPLPDVDLEEVQSRTVVAENLPEDHSIESLELLFSSVGNVKMVRICQPEAANGANQTAAKFKSDMVVSNKLHALVEFETLEQAEKAVVALTDKGNWRSGLRVRLLLRRTFQGKHGFQQGSFQKGRKGGGEESGEEDETGAEDKSWEDFGQHYDRSEEAPGNEGNGLVDRDGGGKKGKGRGRGRGAAGRGKGQHSGSHHVGSNGSRNHQLGTSPQTSHNPISSETVGRPPPGPRMPDGTRGFTLGRGKVPIMGSA